eukprot:5513197-Amphidinium_carterae.2
MAARREAAGTASGLSAHVVYEHRAPIDLSMGAPSHQSLRNPQWYPAALAESHFKTTCNQP